MHSETSLLALPVSVLRVVALDLPLVDLCNLRLTARELAVNIARTATFASFFTSKSLVLREDDLKAFVQVTSLAWLSSALQHLTIVGVPPDPEDQPLSPETQDAELLELLKCAFSKLQEHASDRRPRSLSLDIKTRLDGVLKSNAFAKDWHAVWHCAGRTLRLVSQAARSSMLQFERLDLYGTTERCALSLPHLRHVAEAFDVRKVKALALTISTSDTEPGPGLTQCMVDLLTLTTNLEQLELRYFELGSSDAATAAAEADDCNFFGSISTLSFPHLKILALRGLHMSEEALLTFLTTHATLTELTIEHSVLTHGRYQPIFAHIDTNMVALEELYLSHLGEPKFILFTSAKGKPHYPRTGCIAPDWMSRSKGDKKLRKKAIRYREVTGRPLGSPLFTNWLRKTALLYGPAGSARINLRGTTQKKNG